MIISSFFFVISDLGGIQTRDLQNRNLTLYSAKLRDQAFCKITNKIPNFQKIRQICVAHHFMDYLKES